MRQTSLFFFLRGRASHELHQPLPVATETGQSGGLCLASSFGIVHLVRKRRGFPLTLYVAFMHLTCRLHFTPQPDLSCILSVSSCDVLLEYFWWTAWPGIPTLSSWDFPHTVALNVFDFPETYTWEEAYSLRGQSPSRTVCLVILRCVCLIYSVPTLFENKRPECQ